MKYSGIGGQAVMEGVMMKNGDACAVAVRTADGEIVVEKKEIKKSEAVKAVEKVPILRGVVSFVDSLVLGMKSLMYSSTFFEEDEEDRKKKEKDPEKAKKQEKAEIAGTVVFAIVIAVFVFMLLPYYASQFFSRWVSSGIALSFIEGGIRLLLFLLYIWGISHMEDIRRVFMYHGSEHKCINCIEHGLDLTVENVRGSSRQHKRCGTSFLLIVMLVSIVLFAFIQTDVRLLRVVLRIALIPVVAGISYEFIRLAGRSDHPVVNFFSQPGLWLQNMTTREPDDSMIEVGIASVEAVFDWKPYVEKLRGENAGEQSPGSAERIAS